MKWIAFVGYGDTANNFIIVDHMGMTVLPPPYIVTTAAITLTTHLQPGDR